MSTLTTQTKVLTNAILKEILTDTVSDRDLCYDADETTQSGVYRLNTYIGTTNVPPGCSLGFLIVLATGVTVLQVFVSHTASGIYVRTRWDTWSAFYKVNATISS